MLELKRIGIAGLAFYDYDHLRRAGLAPVKAAFDALELGMNAPLAQAALTTAGDGVRRQA